jgi:hypothetical protein
MSVSFNKGIFLFNRTPKQALEVLLKGDYQLHRPFQLALSRLGIRLNLGKLSICLLFHLSTDSLQTL